MGLITIGGQSAYIIDSKPAEVGRTSTGTGYAQLVSQQRWKIWEEAQKSVLRQMEFEKMGYEAQLDAFKKQKEQLNKALLKAEEIKTKVKDGSMGNSEALRLSGQLLSYGKSQAERDRVDVTKGKRQAVDKYSGLPMFDENKNPIMIESESKRQRAYVDEEGNPLPGPIDPITALRRAQSALGVETPADRKRASVAALEAEWKKGFENRTDKNLDAASWAKSEGKEIDAKLAAERAKPVSDFSQDAAKKEEAVSGLDERIAEIQAEIDALSAPEVGFDTNVLSRTREAFGGMAGVGGLGFAPRRSKISPIYDEGRAREAMAAQAPGFNEAIALAASKASDDMRNEILKVRSAEAKRKIQDYEALGGLESDNPETYAKLKQQRDNPSLTTEEEANIVRTGKDDAMKQFRAEALIAGPGERTAGQFMSKQPTEVAPRPDSSPRTKISDLDIFKNFSLPGVDAAGFQLGGQGPVEAPPSPAVVSPRYEAPAGSALGTPGTTSRAPSLEVEGVRPRVKITPPAPEIVFGGGVMPPTPEEPPAPSGAFELPDDNNIDIGTLRANSSADLYNFFAPETTDVNGKKVGCKV